VINMAKINKINLCFDYNTAWFDDCDGMTDYFPNTSGPLKNIINSVLEYGSDKIIVTVTNNCSEIPAASRVKRICKACGYEAVDKGHIHTYENGLERYVYEWMLTRVKAMPKPEQQAYICNKDQILKIGDKIKNRYGDIFKVITVKKNAYLNAQSIEFSKLMKSGRVCKRMYSGLGYEYQRMEA